MWTLMVNHANTADLVLSPSAHFKNKLAHYGVTRPIEVLPNGVLDDLFVPDLKPKKLEPGEPLRIIWHSRVSKEKSIMPFLEALAQVKGDYRLDVYGDGNDLKNAEKYVKKHSLKVFFHGAKPFKEVYPEIIKSHLDVLNSYKFDTFGMTLVEGESAGTPVLYVDPDLKEVTIPEGSVLASSPDPATVGAAITNLIENPEKIEKMSKAMLTHRDQVRVTKVVDKLEKYIIIKV
jgi:glycosyltransferase involved in cell wall biosynthesis